jgi:hypothetical protein
MVDGRHVTNDAAGQRKTVYGNSHKEVAEKLAQGLTTKDDVVEFYPTTTTVWEFFGAVRRSST